MVALFIINSSQMGTIQVSINQLSVKKWCMYTKDYNSAIKRIQSYHNTNINI